MSASAGQPVPSALVGADFPAGLRESVNKVLDETNTQGQAETSKDASQDADVAASGAITEKAEDEADDADDERDPGENRADYGHNGRHNHDESGEDAEDDGNQVHTPIMRRSPADCSASPVSIPLMSPGTSTHSSRLRHQGDRLIERRVQHMRVAVIGGTGLVGRHATKALRQAGHDAVVVARAAGLDVIAGTGLDAALAGVESVIDVSNTAAPDAEAAREFFATTTGHLLAAEQRAGVGHHVMLSIVGLDRVEGNAHYAGKRRQEELARNGPVPATIVRATQVSRVRGDGRRLDSAG